MVPTTPIPNHGRRKRSEKLFNGVLEGAMDEEVDATMRMSKSLARWLGDSTLVPRIPQWNRPYRALSLSSLVLLLTGGSVRPRETPEGSELNHRTVSSIMEVTPSARVDLLRVCYALAVEGDVD